MNPSTKPVAWLLAAFLLLALPLLLPTGAAAEEEDEPEFMQRLFAPELILANAKAIGLGKDQQRGIMSELKDAQLRATEAEFSVYEAALALNELSEADEIDEKAMIAAARQVFVAEGQIKEAHLSALIRIRNALTKSQREKLTRIRDGGG